MGSNLGASHIKETLPSYFTGHAGVCAATGKAMKQEAGKEAESAMKSIDQEKDGGPRAGRGAAVSATMMADGMLCSTWPNGTRDSNLT